MSELANGNPETVPDAPISNRERMAIPRQHPEEQDAGARIGNFDEVSLGFIQQIARLEAERCLRCKNPTCITGCPVRVNIPRFIERMGAGDMPGAADSLLADNALPCVTGRVCPQELQCEAKCLRGRKGAPVAIGLLERYVADWATMHPADSAAVPASGKSVAVVGAGPGGLACAGQLNRRGHAVTVFEAFHAPGGVLLYGIPGFRLPKRVVDDEVARLTADGVQFEYNSIIGRTWSLAELRARFDAVFLAVGAGLPIFLDIPGENLKGVYSANEYLSRVNLMGAAEPGSDTPVLRGVKVEVIGGGNVAMDAVRVARRLGAAATIAYRRGAGELPARAEEVEHARAEGIEFEFLASPIEILGDERGWVRGVRYVRMALGEPDADGRAHPAAVPGSEFERPADQVIIALGTRANPLLTTASPELARNAAGYLEVDETGATNVAGIFAGGDIVRGSATVIAAMGDGKRAALAIDAYLAGVLELQSER